MINYSVVIAAIIVLLRTIHAVMQNNIGETRFRVIICPGRGLVAGIYFDNYVKFNFVHLSDLRRSQEGIAICFPCPFFVVAYWHETTKIVRARWFEVTLQMSTTNSNFPSREFKKLSLKISSFMLRDCPKNGVEVFFYILCSFTLLAKRKMHPTGGLIP